MHAHSPSAGGEKPLVRGLYRAAAAAARATVAYLVTLLDRNDPSWQIDMRLSTFRRASGGF